MSDSTIRGLDSSSLSQEAIERMKQLRESQPKPDSSNAEIEDLDPSASKVIGNDDDQTKKHDSADSEVSNQNYDDVPSTVPTTERAKGPDDVSTEETIVPTTREKSKRSLSEQTISVTDDIPPMDDTPKVRRKTRSDSSESSQRTKRKPKQETDVEILTEEVTKPRVRKSRKKPEISQEEIIVDAPPKKGHFHKLKPGTESSTKGNVFVGATLAGNIGYKTTGVEMPITNLGIGVTGLIGMEYKKTVECLPDGRIAVSKEGFSGVGGEIKADGLLATTTVGSKSGALRGDAGLYLRKKYTFKNTDVATQFYSLSKSERREIRHNAGKDVTLHGVNCKDLVIGDFASKKTLATKKTLEVKGMKWLRPSEISNKSGHSPIQWFKRWAGSFHAMSYKRESISYTEKRKVVGDDDTLQTQKKKLQKDTFTLKTEAHKGLWRTDETGIKLDMTSVRKDGKLKPERAKLTLDLSFDKLKTITGGDRTERDLLAMKIRSRIRRVVEDAYGKDKIMDVNSLNRAVNLVFDQLAERNKKTLTEVEGRSEANHEGVQRLKDSADDMIAHRSFAIGSNSIDIGGPKFSFKGAVDVGAMLSIKLDAKPNADGVLVFDAPVIGTKLMGGASLEAGVGFGIVKGSPISASVTAKVGLGGALEDTVYDVDLLNQVTKPTFTERTQRANDGATRYDKADEGVFQDLVPPLSKWRKG